MATHVIIDGYNLLGASERGSRTTGQDGEASRERLLHDLATYQHRVGHTITVVFDAWRQHGGTQHHEHRTGVTVIFTKQGEQADQVIQRMVRAQSQNCVVVSSDHEIIATAQAHGAMVLRSQVFLTKLREQTVSSRHAESAILHDDPDMNQMRRPDKKGNPRKLPKAVRQRLRKLKKF
ncbi:NYN domain-containing protein [Candidatus Nitrospira salsa]